MSEKYRIKLKDEDINLSKMSKRNREYLAEHSKDENILRKLAKDKDKDVRCYVANNYKTSVDILRKLAGDDNYWVRWCIAENPNTPVDVLRQLSEDESWNVREAVVSNPNCPKDI